MKNKETVMLPLSIQRDKKTKYTYESIKHSINVIYDLMTMYHMRKYTKSFGGEMNGENYDELMNLATEQAKHDLEIMFDIISSEIK